MFKDIDLSKEIMTAFRATDVCLSYGLIVTWLQEYPKKIDFSISVLTQSFWPTFPQTQVTLPDEERSSFYFVYNNV